MAEPFESGDKTEQPSAKKNDALSDPAKLQPAENRMQTWTLPLSQSGARGYCEISSDNDTDDQDVTEKVSSVSYSSKESSPEFDNSLCSAPTSNDDDTAPLLTSPDPALRSGQLTSPEPAPRPGQLPLPRPIFIPEGEDAVTTMLGASLQEQGTVTREGAMIEFVADDLNRLIKLSSPLSRSVASGDGLQSPGAASSTSAWSDSTSSASEWSRDCSYMSRSPSILTGSPDDIPSVDSKALMDLQSHACKVASSLKDITDKLQHKLHKISKLSHENLKVYKEGVTNTCDAVDTSIKSMYALMAKCEELSQTMKPVYQLHTQVEEIKRLLDLYEKEAQASQAK